MNENLNGERTESNGTTSTENQNDSRDNSIKKVNPIVKYKAIILGLVIVVYTIIVATVTVKIDRAILAHQIQKNLENAFSFDDDSQSKAKDDDSESEKDDSETENDESEAEKAVSKKENKTSKNTVTVEVNQMVSQEDVYEATVIGYDFGKKIMPANPPSYYTYYEAKEDGHQYLDLKINYKNLEGTGVSADEVAGVKLKYAGKYEYTSFSVIEDSDGDFTYTNITDIAPLTVGKMHYLFEIPDEVAQNTESLVATITIKGNMYEFVIR